MLSDKKGAKHSLSPMLINVTITYTMSILALDARLKTLPTKPGVYLFIDRQGKVIYVGKAANLQSRIRHYFSPSISLSSKLQKLLANTHDFEYLVTNSEQEALITESNFIKKYRPNYNVRLKDDKTFPYIKVDLDNEWPRIYLTRRFHKNRSRYFGPFASAGSVRKTLRLIKKIFPFRSCNKKITGKDPKPCLEYHIHRCLGPCIGAISKEEYDEVIREVTLFLDGKQELVLRELNDRMGKAAQQLKFEKAALIRDQIRAIEQIIEGQRIAITLRGDQDVIAMAKSKHSAYVEIFFVRNSKLISRDHLLLEGTFDEEPSQIMASFIKQYYASATSIPPVILLQRHIDEADIIAKWLTSQCGASVKVNVPIRGIKKQLVDLVAKNASQGLDSYQTKQLAETDLSSILKELQENLNLPNLPSRIEGYDVSNIKGNLPVGSMIVFDKGLPKPAHYRRFKVQSIASADDYAMIQEVLRRRFKQHLDVDAKWAILPDLILIDGGKGHLNAALEIIREVGLPEIPIASLAKEKEEVFVPTIPSAVNISRTSAALHLLQRVRDEAHRFALGYHQKLRHKRSMASALDNIPGIGPKRKRKLLMKFGTVRSIKEASTLDLTSVEGITNALAQKIKDCL